MLKFRIKELMDDQKLTIQDVHEKTGISRNAISMLYNNKSKGIQLDTLDKLANVLGVYSLEELFENYLDYNGVFDHEINYNLDDVYGYDNGFCNLNLFHKFDNNSLISFDMFVVLKESKRTAVFTAIRDGLEIFRDDISQLENDINSFFKSHDFYVEYTLALAVKTMVSDKNINKEWICFNSDIGFFENSKSANISFCWDKKFLSLKNDEIESILKDKYDVSW